MARKYQKYTPEFREEIATLVVEGQRANCSWLATSTYVVLSDQRPGAVDHIQPASTPARSTTILRCRGLPPQAPL
jgi:hypothetical protein